jgi:hypothetical protein
VGATLVKALLLDTDLRGADLTGALLERTRMSGVRLGGACLSGSRGVEQVVVLGQLDTGLDDALEWRSDADALDWLVRQAQRPGPD